MSRAFSLDDRIWASSGLKVDPDTVTTSEANLLTVAGGHIDSQGPFSDMMNWEQNRIGQMLNAVEKSGLLDWSEKTKYEKRSLCLHDNGQIYQSRKDNNKNNPLTDINWWIEYAISGMGDMLKSVYDANNNGNVDVADAIAGISGAANNVYYGKDSSGNIGFHSVVASTGDMEKAVYDTNNDGVVDMAAAILGANTSGISKYYGTGSNGVVGFYDLPAEGDMLKNVYDTNDNGRVDIADAVFGINAASNLTYYGKDENGVAGFFRLLDKLPVYATRWPTAAEVGALPANGAAENSKLLNGAPSDVSATPDTIAKRDSGADISVRLIKSNFKRYADYDPADNNKPIVADAEIAFRNNTTTDNFVKFIDKQNFKTWLGFTPTDVGLGDIKDYPISHEANATNQSKQKYASEFAVSTAWQLAKQALDASSGGGGGASDTAKKLETPRVIALSGDVVGSVNFDGSQNVNMSTTVADNSHDHLWANITNVPETAKRWPTAAEVGALTQAQGDSRYIGKNDVSAIPPANESAVVGSGFGGFRYTLTDGGKTLNLFTN